MMGLDEEEDPDLVFIILNTQATKEILLYWKTSEEGEEDSQENTIAIKGYFTTRRIEVKELENKLIEMAKRKGNIDDAREAFIEDFVENIENTAYVLDFSDMFVLTGTAIIKDGEINPINEDIQKIPGILIVSVRKETGEKRAIGIPLTEIPDDLKNTQLEFTNMCNCRFIEAFVSIKTNGAVSESRDPGPYY